ncbi:hypothetical protein [Jiangella asiatica]|uniref:Uncharacterized protein n=1 Tax=Jiangella asiatica TaxID=2530372 RepID=A0A4R5CK38_9ACTN|nr:hypothetical protein [Jiangella asiatica]TDD98980.1 hypothetical protein E1269_27880 [Jiangella asiatica]
MTAVVVAMLAIVLVATVVLGVVGLYHHLANSPQMRRRMRRWRYLALVRMDGWRDAAFTALRRMRRGLARRLTSAATS